MGPVDRRALCAHVLKTVQKKACFVRLGGERFGVDVALALGAGGEAGGEGGARARAREAPESEDEDEDEDGPDFGTPD